MMACVVALGDPSIIDGKDRKADSGVLLMTRNGSRFMVLGQASSTA